MLLNNDTWLRIGMLGVLLAPCAAILLWAYYAEPNTEVAPTPSVPCKEREEAEEGLESDFLTLPADHEAVQQIREAMAGKVVKCAVCQVEFPDLYRVQFADGSAFCCHVCAALLRAGSPT